MVDGPIRAILGLLWDPRSAVTGRWELNDEQWAVVEPVLRPAWRANRRGCPWHDTRSVLNGVLWVLGTGAQWREMPEKYLSLITYSTQDENWDTRGCIPDLATKVAA
jgi:transposase